MSLSRARIARYHLLAWSYRGLSRATLAASGRLMHFLMLGVEWGFWAITLVPDMLEGQSKGSIDAGDHLVCKTSLRQILVYWIGVQGPSKLVKKTKTPPLCEPLPGEPLTQIKNFF